MSKQKGRRHVVIWGVCIVILLCGYWAASSFASITYDPYASRGEAKVETVEKEPEQPRVVHLATPEPTKAIYMTQCVVGTPSFRAQLVDLIETTELNSVIIDIKDFSGKLAFGTDNPKLSASVSDACGARDMESFIELLHSKGIYVIGRITVFQDPYYAEAHPNLAVKRASDGGVWHDYKKLSFIDVGAREYWDYIVEITKESYAIGFDELNFDYIRFPSDGNMKDIAFPHSGSRPKQEVLEDFFAYLYDEVKDPDNFDGDGVPVISADLFGMTTTNTDDLNIGQVLERTLPYFDYVMPMVYPSHYPSGFNGWTKPATVPYEVVKFAMDAAVRRARTLAASENSTGTTTEAVRLRELAGKGHGNVSPTQLRTWIQDFDLGATYTSDMVRAQIQATYDAGLTSWALWDAGNTYTRAALKAHVNN